MGRRDNGATQTAEILGPINEKDGGRLRGMEAAYQTFFDFLPGLLSGLGMQANYTYVNQSGIHNSNLIDVGGLNAGGVGAFGAGQEAVGGVVIDSHKLQGVSTNTFNLVGLYEKGPVGVRLAYNWRSRYLTQNLDCCIGLPVFQKAAGFLDGSVRFMCSWATTPEAVDELAEALKALGSSRAMVVHGRDGMDEVTNTDVTATAALDGKATLPAPPAAATTASPGRGN